MTDSSTERRRRAVSRRESSDLTVPESVESLADAEQPEPRLALTHAEGDSRRTDAVVPDRAAQAIVNVPAGWTRRRRRSAARYSSGLPGRPGRWLFRRESPPARPSSLRRGSGCPCAPKTPRPGTRAPAAGRGRPGSSGGARGRDASTGPRSRPRTSRPAAAARDSGLRQLAADLRQGQVDRRRDLTRFVVELMGDPLGLLLLARRYRARRLRSASRCASTWR